jgi:hypothetical protein
MVSCRIGLVVCVCVGMQWNSKLSIDGECGWRGIASAHTCRAGYTADSDRAPLDVAQPPLEANGRRGLIGSNASTCAVPHAMRLRLPS